MLKFLSKKREWSKLLIKLLKGVFKLIKFIFLICVVLCVAALVMNISVIATSYSDVVQTEDIEDNTYDCILVLGCSVYANGKPSPALRERLDKAIEIYKEGKAKKILMSGDHSGQYYNEVKVMKNYAVANGVPSQDVFLDHYGISTYDSLSRAKSVFELESVIVVTQGYHVYRAVWDAKYFGMETKGVACGNKMTTDIKTNIREFVARCKDFTFCMLKVETEYKGGTISIFGDGDTTNNRNDLP